MGSQFCRQSPPSLPPLPLPIFFSPSYFAKRGAAPPPSNEITPLSKSAPETFIFSGCFPISLRTSGAASRRVLETLRHCCCQCHLQFANFIFSPYFHSNTSPDVNVSCPPAARACELFRSLACRTYSLKIAILNIDDSSIMAMNHGHAFIQFVLCAFSVACQMAVIFLMPG